MKPRKKDDPYEDLMLLEPKVRCVDPATHFLGLYIYCEEHAAAEYVAQKLSNRNVPKPAPIPLYLGSWQKEIRKRLLQRQSVVTPMDHPGGPTTHWLGQYEQRFFALFAWLLAHGYGHDYGIVTETIYSGNSTVLRHERSNRPYVRIYLTEHNIARLEK